MTDAPTVAWSDVYDASEYGVDQLGLRVAGEEAYSSLIDFITTVSWRPRYFTFLLWAMDQAWEAGSRQQGARDIEVNPRVWATRLRELDYALVAASLMSARGPQGGSDAEPDRLAGSTKVSAALDRLEDPDAELELAGDHLRASTGSLGLYLGPMRQFRLVETVSLGNRSVHRPSKKGRQLAAAFGETLASVPIEEPLDTGTINKSDLITLGDRCGFQMLGRAGGRSAEAARELELLRDLVVDWSGFGKGTGKSAPRILTIGVILKLHELTEGQCDRRTFRRAMLCGPTDSNEGNAGWGLSEAYEPVLLRWKIYQAHAYATFALEALLGVVLDVALTRGSPVQPVGYRGLLETVCGEAASISASMDVGPIARWLELPLDEVVANIAQADLDAPGCTFAEPALMESISALVNRHGRSAASARWAHDAALMTLVSLVRIRTLASAGQLDAWTGDNQASRLPPATMSEFLETRLARNMTALDFAAEAFDQLAVLQHRRNALRKLAADPRNDTSKLIVEGDQLTPLAAIVPGTSNPRFDNAVVFLTDLGFLDDERLVTEDGAQLLVEIDERSR